MICDFLASFTRREEKRPQPGKGRSHASEPHAHRDHAAVGSAPDALARPGRRETLP
jgi:hypothetical protein